MRVMVIVKASKNCEADVPPDEKFMAEMGRYNEELTKAGVFLGMERLHPSSKGARVRFSGAQRTVTDGPFAESKELVGGYWLWQVESLQDAIEWLKRAPFIEAEIEIRQVREAEDRGAKITEAFREQATPRRARVE